MRIKQIGIYMIRNIKDNKFYVGRTIDFHKRIISHRTELNNNIHHSYRLQRAWNKHKEESFEFLMIEECDISVYHNREQFWIDTLKPEYNLLSSSRGGRYEKHTQETINKIRESKKNTVGKKIYQFSLDGDFIKYYDCISDAMREFNKNSTSHFIQCCQGKRNYAYGYKWSYTSEL